MRYAIRAICCSGLALTACATGRERPALSTAGCAKAVVRELPDGLTDPEKHCLASALIVRRCSRFEAWLAGWGKEARDALGDGYASRADLEANRIGRDCVTGDGGSGELLACCRSRLPAG